jgi:glycosyltransferase 2 family protein
LKRWIGLAAGFIISVIFLMIGFNGLHLDSVVTAIQGANLIWIIPGVLVYFLAVWGRTWRWHYMLRPIKRIPLRKLFPIVVIGYMGNNVYPFRAGEVIRSYVLYRNEGVKVSASLATVIVERIFDGLVMLIFVFAALPFAPIQEAWLRNVIIGGTLVFFGALVVFLFMATRPAFARATYTRIFGILPEKIGAKLISIADHFMEGLESLRSPRDLLMTFVTSIFIWLTETVKYWFVLQAFPQLAYNPQITFFVLMIMTAVVNLATTIPSAPGYIGTFDGPGIAVMKLFGADGTLAAGYTLVLHAALWLPITLLGFYYLAREGLNWRSFDQAAQEVEKQKHTAEGIAV